MERLATVKGGSMATRNTYVFEYLYEYKARFFNLALLHRNQKDLLNANC